MIKKLWWSIVGMALLVHLAVYFSWRGIMNIKAAVLYNIFKTVYFVFGRNLLLKAIDDPDQMWDDMAMSGADKFFGYKK